jgi:hypothetical protein
MVPSVGLGHDLQVVLQGQSDASAFRSRSMSSAIRILITSTTVFPLSRPQAQGANALLIPYQHSMSSSF